MTGQQPHLRALPSPTKDPAGRPPPADLEAERAVLSNAMLTGGIDEIRDLVTTADFYCAEHRHIAGVCWELADRGVSLDVVTVAHDLRERKLDKTVPIALLGEITDACPAVSNVRDHAAIVAKLARSRRLIATCQRIAAEGYGNVGERDEWLTGAVREVEELAAEIPTDHAVTLEESLHAAMGKIWGAIENRGKLLGLSTGLAELNEQTAGLHPGDVTALTAPTKGGKTALACQLAITVAEQGRGVVFFSLEMPHEQLSTRMCCAEARVNWHAIRLGHHTERDYAALITASERLRSLPLVINRKRGMKVRELLGRARRSAAEFDERGAPLGLIVVDYMQLLDCRDEVPQRSTRERELARGARLVVELAEELNVAVLALAQTNEEGQIRESKAILHEATGWWDIHVDQDGKGPRSTEIRIPVQRHGPSGVSATCWFHPAYVVFSDQSSLPFEGAP